MLTSEQKYIVYLISRYVAGKLSVEETGKLEQWRKVSVENEALFQKMTSAEELERNMIRFIKTPLDAETEWQLILKRTGLRKSLPPRRHLIWLRYAAVLILPLALAITFYFIKPFASLRKGKQVDSSLIVPGMKQAVLVLENGTELDLSRNFTDRGICNEKNALHYVASEKSTEEKGGYHLLKVPRGGEYTLVLEDGTIVFLNAESQLKYPVHFSGNTRKVELLGEAYFEVNRDEKHPFIVQAGQVEVKVLGTSFGIRAYREDERILATLVNGRVNVEVNDRKVSLLPAEQAVFDKADGKLSVRDVDVELYVGWKNGRLIFDNASLEDVMTELKRWYSFEVSYADESLRKIPFSLNIQKYEDFREVLLLLEHTGKLTCRIEGDRVIVK